MNAMLARHLDWFASLSPASLTDIDRVYAADARFSDPFQKIEGREAIGAVYGRMFEKLQAPRFTIIDTVCEDKRAFVTWDFSFSLMGRARSIHGGSLLLLDEAGLITEHRDYWDAAGGVYEALPLLGTLLRWLKRRMA
ncbi:nuclear transport factor 2 family protein [Craterilacuibacter sp.]|uniref:nuclear transport factor 2 family protein n=1 Tax=Craterilacuibacter sp. TaxID=2870909 RepID=UPI003F2A137D